MQSLNNSVSDRNLSRFGFGALIIFGVGCGVSNSLVSLGAHLWSFYVIYWLIQSWKSIGIRASLYNDKVLFVGLAYVLFTLVCLLILAPVEKWNRDVGAWLFFFYWVIAFGKSSLRLNTKKLLTADRVVGLAYFGLWAVCWYQHHSMGFERVNGVHNNPNRLACAILPPMIYFGERLLGGAYRAKYRDRVFFGLLWLLIFHIVFMTQTRSIFPFVMIYVSGLMARFAYRYRARLNRVSIAGLLGVLVVGVGLLANSATVSRFDLSRLSTDGNVLSRLEFWRINWNMFLESPVWGTGFRQNLLNVADQPGLQPYMDMSGMYFLAHNTYVQVLTESGVIGFALFFGFLGLAFFKRPHLRWFIFSVLLVGVADTSLHLARAIPAMIFFVTLMNYAEKVKSPLNTEGS